MVQVHCKVQGFDRKERMNATEFLHYPHLCKRGSQKSRWRQTGLVPCGVRTSDWWIKAPRAGIVTKQDPRQPRCNHVFMQLRAPGKAPARKKRCFFVPFGFASIHPSDTHMKLHTLHILSSGDLIRTSQRQFKLFQFQSISGWWRLVWFPS